MKYFILTTIALISLIGCSAQGSINANPAPTPTPTATPLIIIN